MEKRKRKNKNWLVLTGSLFFLIGIGIITYDYLSNKKLDNQEELALESYYNNIEEINEESTDDTQVIEEVKEQIKINYIAILKIPKIDLERGLVDPDNYLNNVNYNLEFVDGTSMPDEKNSNTIIAGHSGNSRTSYFKNLDKLSIEDEIIILYKKETYTYKVVDIYEIEKTGTAEIIRDKNKKVITLITCKHNTNKQIIVIGEEI